MARILLIEDDGLVAETIENALRKAGHTVVVAADGAQGQSIYAATQPDLVIADILMPGQEGLETIRQLRIRAPDVPILAISGGGTSRNFDFLTIAQKLGASKTLRKPFNSADLRACIALLTAA